MLLLFVRRVPLIIRHAAPPEFGGGSKKDKLLRAAMGGVDCLL